MNTKYDEIAEGIWSILLLFKYIKGGNKLANFFTWNSYAYRKFCDSGFIKRLNDPWHQEFNYGPFPDTRMEFRRSTTMESINKMFKEMAKDGEWIVSNDGKVNPILMDKMDKFFLFKDNEGKGLNTDSLVDHGLSVMFFFLRSPYHTYRIFKDLIHSPVASFFPKEISSLESKISKLLWEHIHAFFENHDYRVDEDGKLYFREVTKGGRW